MKEALDDRSAFLYSFLLLFQRFSLSLGVKAYRINREPEFYLSASKQQLELFLYQSALSSKASISQQRRYQASRQTSSQFVMQSIKIEYIAKRQNWPTRTPTRSPSLPFSSAKASQSPRGKAIPKQTITVIKQAHLVMLRPRITPCFYCCRVSTTLEMQTIGIMSRVSYYTYMLPPNREQMSSMKKNKSSIAIKLQTMVITESNQVKRLARVVPEWMSRSPIEFPINVLLATDRPWFIIKSVVLIVAQIACAA